MRVAFFGGRGRVKKTASPRLVHQVRVPLSDANVGRGAAQMLRSPPYPFQKTWSAAALLVSRCGFTTICTSWSSATKKRRRRSTENCRKSPRSIFDTSGWRTPNKLFHLAQSLPNQFYVLALGNCGYLRSSNCVFFSRQFPAEK